MKIKCPDENVELLLRAVVLRAAKDYRYACARLHRLPYDEDAATLKAEAEAFFLSEDFLAYSFADGNRSCKC